DLPARQGVQKRQGAPRELLHGERRHGLDLARFSSGAVALAQEGDLLREDAVGVGRSSKEDGGRGHWALEHPVDLALMTGAAGLLSHPQVARVDKADELRGLLE